MIEIRVNKINPSKRDLASELENEIINEGAESIADDLKKELKSAKCDNHPDKKSILIITPVTATNFTFDKSGFCCKEFADSIKIKTE